MEQISKEVICKKIIHLQYTDQRIPRKFQANSKISSIIEQAKDLFKCPKEETYVIYINGREQDEEVLLQDLRLEKGQVLELAKKIVSFSAIQGEHEFECSGSLSQSISEAISEALKNFPNIDLASSQFLINGEEIEKNKVLGDIKNIEDIVVELKKYDFQNESRQDQINEEDAFKSDVAPKFSILTEECRQVWNRDNNELDDSKRLNQQLSLTSHNISVQIDFQNRQVEKKLLMNFDENIRELKQKLEKDIGIPSMEQRWSYEGSEEGFEDQVQLSKYFCPDKILKPRIRIKKLESEEKYSIQEKAKAQRFYFFQYDSLPFKKKFAIDDKISTVLLSLKDRLKGGEEAKIELTYNQTPLDPDKCLKDYHIELNGLINLQKVEDNETISVIFEGKILDIPGKKVSSVISLKEEACKMQGISAFHLYSLKLENQILDSSQMLKSIPTLVSDSVFVLTDEIRVFFSLKNQEAPLFNLKISSNSKVLDVKKKIREEITIDFQEFILLFHSRELNDHQNLSQFLNNESARIEIQEKLIKDKLDNQKIREIEVYYCKEQYSVKFTPKETFSDIKSKLAKEGFSDVANFSLQKNGKVFLDKETLEENEILYGKHVMIPKLNLQITVSVDDGEDKCICGNQLVTVGDLKQNLRSYVDDIFQQILILQDDERRWVRRLADDQQKLEELASEGSLKILCKVKKTFWIQVGLQNDVEIFQGTVNSSLQDLKILFEIDSRIPIRNQLWAMKKSRVFKTLDQETFQESLEKNLYSKTNPIRIFRKINLSVCLRDTSEVLEEVPTYETIKDQKDKIAARLNISRRSQRWSYNEKELEDEKTLEECFEKKSDIENSFQFESFALDLIVLDDLEYYGFASKRNINPDFILSFFIESDEDLDRIVDSINFNKTEDSFLLQDKILGLFFATLKRHSLWEGLISKIKKKMFDRRAMNLWENNEKNPENQSKFNTQFLLCYFLNSGTPKLNIEILKIIKMHFPVPLAINTWSNRFSIEGNRIVDELYWVVQKGFFIASFGFGQAENNGYGKTQLNNKLFSSNFALRNERNPICRGCPEALFDVYKNDKFPINIIDVPTETEENLTEKILSCSNMLIIHSFAEEEKTHEFMKTLPKDIPIIVLYRDTQNAFYNVSKFKKSLEEGFKSALKGGKFEIKIADFPNYSKSNELIYVAEKIHEFILEKFGQLKNEDELWRFFKLFEKQDSQVNRIFDKIRERSSQIVKAVPIFTELKKKEKEQAMDVSGSFRDDGGQSVPAKFSIAAELQQVLGLFKSEDASLFLEKFQDYLRMMKNQQTMDFYKLYEFQSKLSGKSENFNKNIIVEFGNYWEKVKNQEAFYRDRHININAASHGEVYKFIDDCIRTFEQRIIPNIFSIELFWRELIYYEDLERRSEHQMPSVFSSAQLINLKRENILKGFPFEIVDGDLLHMPKEFLKNVFKGMTDRVIVISVLGPQSSGKSTLLNFLFGCNFQTSSGRCTKGIYGTYSKVSNFNSCDGILVLDTEGLFGLMNRNDEHNQDKFDRKLVLFCLAISDFVFINFKGDIDRTLTDVLMVCSDSLTKLQQGNMQKPEMFLILNQNSQTNRTTQQQDIHKMKKHGFKEENVKILPLAFDTEKIKISTIERFMELGTKKTPKDDFSEACQSLVQIVFEKISSNGNKGAQRTLENLIDTMEHWWELIGKYSFDLLRHGSVQDQVQEKKIKEWIEKEVDENLKRTLTGIANALKHSDKIKLDWEKEFREKFIEQQKLTKHSFESEFKENTGKKLFDDLEIDLHTHIDRIKIELQNELAIQSHKEKIKGYDAHGLEILRDKAYKLRHSGYMTDAKIEQDFEEAWQRYIADYENLHDRKNEARKLFEVVIERYRTDLNRISSCLPDSKPPSRDDRSFENYAFTLKKNIINTFKTQKRFEYTKQPPALVFRGGKSNISFRYFDLRKYFTKKQVNENLGISRSQVWKIFDMKKIRDTICRLPNYEFQQNFVIQRVIDSIYFELRSCGIQVSQKILERSLRHEQKNFFSQFFAEPVKDEDLGCENFSFIKFCDFSSQLKFIDRQKIRDKRNDLDHCRITDKNFKVFILKHGIQWSEVKKVVVNQVEATFQKVHLSNLVSEIEADLAKINVGFIRLQDYLYPLCNWDETDVINLISNNVHSLSQFPVENSGKSQSSLSFNHLKKDVIDKLLQRVDIYDNDFLVIQNLRGEKWVLKEEIIGVRWLKSYAREDLNAIFQNTMEDQALALFVSGQFKFEDLAQDIFTACMAQLQSINNLTSMQLYNKIVRETNDLIGIANNDLQQVSYILDFKLVGEIHLQMVHLIWKYFEERHWEKITKPLQDMKNRKEQQKSFFKSLASSDDEKINKAEAEKVSQQIEEYAKSLVQIQKDEILNAAVDTFKIQNKRSKIQEQLDSKYFSRNALVGDEELFFYVINPFDVILKAYEDASERFCSDLENQIQGQYKFFNDILNELIARIAKVQNQLLKFDEDFWALDNIFEFKTALESKEEVLIKKYNSKIGNIYYKIVLALLKGNTSAIFNEYEIIQSEKDESQIPSKLKLVMKKIKGLEILPLESQGVFRILDILEEQEFGNVTNARIFIDNLLENMNILKESLRKLFTFSAEDFKEFKDKSNIFVCKQQCPCCDRICGEEDPNHKTHRCLYGHQIRAIGGTIIGGSQEASVIRCEDLRDTDKMRYDGKDMNWGQFLVLMMENPNNPWGFDDVVKTRDDQKIRGRFELAWTLVGERICEHYKDLGMKFVHFNQATIDAQKVQAFRPTNYIFMIDSSSNLFKFLFLISQGSMTGRRWNELKISLKETLGKISSIHKDNQVSIISFASTAQIVYENTPANSISIDILDISFGTNFCEAFGAGFELLKKETQKNIVLIFMTDGEADYPTNEIDAIQEYLSSPDFINLGIEFSFNAIAFRRRKQNPVQPMICQGDQSSDEDVIDRLVKDLDGTPYFADSGADLTKAYIEILNKKD